MTSPNNALTKYMTNLTKIMQNLTNTNNWLISNQRHLDSEYTKVLKETTAKFTSKLIEQENNISSLNTSFEELLDKISVSNRFDSKIE